MNSTVYAPQTVEKQSCTIVSLYRPLLVYVLGLVVMLFGYGFIAAAVFLVAAPCLRWAYIRLVFPRISQRLGYTRVEDRLPSHVAKAPVEVNYYSFVGCPFCPIMEQRLDALQKQMGFKLHHIDVTLKPQILTEKGIRSVPVVEAGQKRLIGHATTEQLAELIGTAAA